MKNVRNLALSGASVFALCAGTASAQTLVSEFEGGLGLTPTTVDVYEYALRGVTNQETLSGVKLGEIVGTFVDLVGTFPSGPQSVSANIYSSTGFGNTVTNLAIDDTDASVDAGTRVLSSQVVAGDGAGDGIVQAFVRTETPGVTPNILVGMDIVGLTGDTATVDNNTIDASATLNDSNTSLSEVASQDISPVAGSAVLDLTTPDTISADIFDSFNSIQNVQQAVDSGTLSGSGALVGQTDIALDIDVVDAGGATQDMDGNRSLKGNRLGASFTANATVNEVTDFDSAEINGGTIVFNAQIVDESGASSDPLDPPDSAAIIDSRIASSFENVDNFTGVLDASGNVLSADAAGNSAVNGLLFADGVEVTGAGVSSFGSFDVLTGFDIAADFGIGSFQSNTNSRVSSLISNSDISSEITGDGSANVTGGEVSVSNNNQSATATGNTAQNVVSVADAVSFSATTAVGSVQSTSDTPVIASITDSSVYSDVENNVTDGVISLGGNTLSAQAIGNAAVNQTSISGASLTMGGNETFTISNIGGLVSVGTTAADGPGAFLANVQSSLDDGGGVTPTVEASVTESVIRTEIGGDASGSTLQTEGNTVAAATVVNQGINSLMVDGASGDATAGVANAQTNFVAASASVVGLLDGAGTDPVAGADIGISMTDTASVSDSIFSVDDNDVLATVDANFANNTLRITGTSNANDLSTRAADAYSFILSSSQVGANDVTTSVDAVQVGMFAGSIDGGSIVSVANNQLAALGRNNVAFNTLDLGADSSDPSDTSGFSTLTTAALLENTQGSNVAVTSTIARSMVNVDVGQDSAPGTGIDEAQIDVSDSSFAASAQANQAANLMNVDAQSLVFGDAAIDPADLFVLDNAQATTGDAGAVITAEVTGNGTDGADIGLNLEAEDDVTDSTIAVGGNETTAFAEANFASNTMQVTGQSFASDFTNRADSEYSVNLLSEQIGASDVSASVDDVQIGSSSGSIAGSIFGLTGNELTAEGRNNVAFNTVDLAEFSTLSTTALLVNDQESNASVTSTITDSMINVGADLDGATGTGAIGETQIDVSDNNVAASAQANQATNIMNVDALSMAFSAIDPVNFFQIDSIQSSSESVIAEVTGSGTSGADIGVDLDDTDTVTDNLIAVSGNVTTAFADGNIATNLFGATGTSIVNQLDLREDDEFAFSLSNFQDGGAGSIDASITDMHVGVHAGSVEEAIDGSGSLVSINDNQLVAAGRSNFSVNVFDLGGDSIGGTNPSGFSDLTTTAVVINDQASSNAVTSTISNNTIGVEALNASADFGASQMSVSDNIMQALSQGNASETILNVAAVNIDLSGIADVAGDALSVINDQTNTGAITAEILNNAVGLNAIDASGGGTAASGVGTSVVARNTAIATGVGNSASNTHRIAALSTASVAGGVSNFQSNAGSVIARVSGLDTGVTSTLSSSGLNSVRGNVVSATAVGNSAVNRITRSN